MKETYSFILSRSLRAPTLLWTLLRNAQSQKMKQQSPQVRNNAHPLNAPLDTLISARRCSSAQYFMSTRVYRVKQSVSQT